MDPYARVVGRTVKWNDALFGFTPGDDDRPDTRDSAPYAPIAAVVDTAFTWGDDRPLRTPWHKTLIYELHVKGFTKLNPRIPKRCAGRTWDLLPSRPSGISHHSE